MADPITPLTMADLRKKVSNYQNFAITASQSAPKDVFTSAVFSKEVIQKLLDTTPETHGIRIYLAKNSVNDTQDDISYLAVPVKAGTQGAYEDQIADGHEHLETGLIEKTDCIGKFCFGSSLIS